MGGLRHNTVVVVWPDEWATSHEITVCQRFVSTLRAADAADCAILVPKNVKIFPSSHVKVFIYLIIISLLFSVFLFFNIKYFEMSRKLYILMEKLYFLSNLNLNFKINILKIFDSFGKKNTLELNLTLVIFINYVK